MIDTRGDYIVAAFVEGFPTPAAPATETVETVEAAPAAAAPLATPNQITLIEKLLRQGRGDEGGFMAGPTDRAGIAALTRRQASRYIDSLRDAY